MAILNYGMAADSEEEAKTVRFSGTVNHITSDEHPSLLEIFKLKRLPLPSGSFELEVSGVPTAVPNAIRRVLIDELTSYRLGIDQQQFIDYDKHTEVYSIYSMLLLGISNVRLKYNIDPVEASKLRLKLEITNKSQFNMPVYSGDLQVTSGNPSLVICNPTIQLTVVTPGKSVFVDNIKLIKDIGKNSGFNNVGCQVVAKPLDLETYTKKELTAPDGIAANLACYKLQSTVANPRHHMVSGIFNCISDVGEIKNIITDAMDNISKRTQKIEMSLSDTSSRNTDVVYDEKPTSKGSNITEASLVVSGETHTIAVLVNRYVFENDPTIEEINYEIENDSVYFTIKSSKNIRQQLITSLKKIISDINLIKESFLSL